MTEGQSRVSREIYDLHMLIFWICCIIGVMVYLVILWSILTHRRSVHPEPAKFHDNVTLEIVWTVIPSIILLAMAWPSVRVLSEMYDHSEGEVNIKVTGHQWKWRYEYLDETGPDRVNFFSSLATPRDEINNIDEKSENYLLEVDEPLTIPVNTRVRFLITANDVLHSWWVPDFAVKQDAIPGMVNTAWTVAEKTGIFRGQCAELCGKDHGFMPIVVNVVEKPEFEAWKATKLAAAAEMREAQNRDWSKEELYELGEKVYGQHCVACHQVNGQGIPPAFPSLVGDGIVLDDLEKHVDIVLNGVSGTGMAAFGGQLSAAELAAVITYERLAWGNEEKGDGRIVTPKEIIQMQSGGGAQ